MHRVLRERELCFQLACFVVSGHQSVSFIRCLLFKLCVVWQLCVSVAFEMFTSVNYYYSSASFGLYD